MVETSRVARWRKRLREEGKVAMTIWLTEQDKARLLDIAQQWHTSPSALVTEALAGYHPTQPSRVSPDTDASQLRLLIREILREELPGVMREVLVETAMVTDTSAEDVTDAVTDAVAESVTERVTETTAPTGLAAEVLEMLTGVEYDTEKYMLGKLCPRHHDYQGTGQSLLYKRNHVCLACDREKTRERRQARRKA
jgi:hypothetical protein